MQTTGSSQNDAQKYAQNNAQNDAQNDARTYPSKVPPKKQRPRIALPPAQRAFAASRKAAGRSKGTGAGVDVGAGAEMSIEQMQASIEELLGMQGLGSGSWKTSDVPAAVEREQRTLVREIKVRPGFSYAGGVVIGGVVRKKDHTVDAVCACCLFLVSSFAASRAHA